MVLYRATEITAIGEIDMLESWFDGKKQTALNAIERTPDAQLEVDRATEKLALYYYETCWFCGTVRATIDRLNLKIGLRDIHGNEGHLERLMREGGSGTVPCLYIEHPSGQPQWLYESRDISAYLEDRFGPASTA